MFMCVSPEKVCLLCFQYIYLCIPGKFRFLGSICFEAASQTHVSWFFRIALLNAHLCLIMTVCRVPPFFPAEYVVVDEATGEVVEREAGSSRWLSPALGRVPHQGQEPNAEGQYIVMVKDEASTDRWQHEATVRARAAGLAVSMRSFISSNGAGPGDVMDLKSCVDVCASSGLQAVVVDSLGEATGVGSGGALDEAASSFTHAVHPAYTCLSALPDSAADVVKQNMQELKKCASDPAKALAAKLTLLHKVFNATGKGVVESDGFATFVQDNGYWLKPYALFCVFREEHNTGDTTKWGDHSRLTPAQLDALSSPGGAKYVACRFWYWLQYNLHNQLLNVSKYAREKGIALISEVPFAASRCGVDVWARPEIFRADKVIGAPPSESVPRGESWGRSPYDADRMNREGYGWWLGRMRRLATYFHGVKLGQALSFIRQWEMPGTSLTGLGGRQNPCNCITREELDTSGLWDRRRLCEPYVRKHLLERKLGAAWEVVASRFLDYTTEDAYKFKAGLDTEKAIVDSIKAQPLSMEGKTNDELAMELVLMLNDRCLIRDDKAPEDKFYPRALMWNTDSFAELGQVCLPWRVAVMLESARLHTFEWILASF
jgi:4-alpha-glucanotransferase